jgi:thymidine kinase
MLKVPKIVKTTGEITEESPSAPHEVVSPLQANFNSETTVGKVVLDFFDPEITDITVDAPPGSGKTTALVTAVKHIVTMSEAKIMIITPTRTQVSELVTRLLQVLPASAIDIDLNQKADISPLMSMLTAKKKEEAQNEMAKAVAVPGHVSVSTVSRLTMRSNRVAQYHCLIVDEAYQVTYGDYSLVSGCASKHIMVGDPGQIGPVVTAPQQLWSSFHNTNPTRRLQDVTRTSSFKTSHYSINETWRLGPMTTDVVKTLYDFDFESKRPPVEITLDGRPLSEIEVVDVHTPLSRSKPEPTDSIQLMRLVARRVAEFLDSGYVTIHGKREKITAKDIAIVAAYNYQVEEAILVLRSQYGGKNPVEVLTADRAQGKEWRVILAVDPACIPGGAAAHTFSTGRLAVMLSRHSGHLTWYGVHSEEIVDTYDVDLITQSGLDVRDMLYEYPVIDEM